MPSYTIELKLSEKRAKGYSHCNGHDCSPGCPYHVPGKPSRIFRCKAPSGFIRRVNASVARQLKQQLEADDGS